MADKKRWEIELENYLIKKMRSILGEDVDFELYDIETLFNINDISSEEYSIDDLAKHYAYTIMTEDYESSNLIKEELKNRNCELSFDIHEDNETATLNVYYKPETSVAYVDVKFNVVPEGFIIDFESEDF